MLKTTLNLRGEIVDLSQAQVMAIINATPDSFYAASRVKDEETLRQRLEQIIHEGASFVDVGAYSSRPGASTIDIDEERRRLRPILSLIAQDYPRLHVSVDTFRSEVARWAVGEYGVAMINDISGGELDKNMFRTVVELQVPYILMHMRGTPETMQSLTDYTDVGLEVLDYFIHKSEELRAMGLHDLILDPGFGFAKTLEQNYQLLGYLGRLQEALELPLLVGLSRKSMIYKALDCSPEESLSGTMALNTYALMQGANILRVHDVKEARQLCQLHKLITKHQAPAENPIKVIHHNPLS